MTFRPWILGALLLGGIGVNAYLLLDERMAESEKHVRHQVDRVDALLDIRYTKANRKSNLARMGLTEAEVAEAVARLEDLGDPAGGRRETLAMLLENSGDPTRLAEAFCGGGRVQPRYAALPYLVKEAGGKRRAIDARRVSELEPDAWSKTARISEVYGDLELAYERKQDATVMGLGAILLGREQDVIDHRSHWGEGLRGRWSWAGVKKENPGVDQQVIEYLALLHLTMEVATEEGGFCDQ
ncbi:MAG: hypothetical protein ABIO70_19270 [Pseudomonadota bacterium]